MILIIVFIRTRVKLIIILIINKRMHKIFPYHKRDLKQSLSELGSISPLSADMNKVSRFYLKEQNNCLVRLGVESGDAAVGFTVNNNYGNSTCISWQIYNYLSSSVKHTHEEVLYSRKLERMPVTYILVSNWCMVNDHLHSLHYC